MESAVHSEWNCQGELGTQRERSRMRSFCLQILLFAFFSGIMLSPGSAQAGWPWNKKDSSGLRKHSPQWWEYTSSLPVGSRQIYRYGKMWPNRPRPTDPQQTFMQQYHSAHFWPTPYNQQDKAIVNVFEAAQIDKGWRNATTLYDHHFSPISNELTRSGRQHILWILQNLENHHQSIHVQISPEGHINTMRVASVNNYLAELNTGRLGRPLDVVLDLTSPVTRPAREVEIYQKAWVDGMLSPHIPYSVEGGSSGGE